MNPISERESLILGDWVMSRIKKDNPDPRYNSPIHLGLEGLSPYEARRALRSVGYYVSVTELLRALGRS